MSYLAEPTHVQFIEVPYRLWIVDRFLRPDVIDELLTSWPEDDDERWFRGRPTIDGRPNVLERGMLAISDVAKMPPYIADVMQFLHSDELTGRIADITGDDDLVADTSMRWSGVRTMLPGSCQLIHSDARRNPITGLRKYLAVMLYMNRDYAPDHDGCLEVWDDEMRACQVRIEPRLNRLVIFENIDTSYHGVPCVNADRRLLTFSVMKRGHFDSDARVKAKFVARPQDPPDVDVIGLQRSLLTDY